MAEPATGADLADMRLCAAAAVARYHGFTLDRRDLQAEPDAGLPSPAALASWLQGPGLVAQARLLSWAQVLRLCPGTGAAPAVLLFADGSAGVLVGSNPARGTVWLCDPRSPGAARAMGQAQLAQLWQGQAILVRRPRGGPAMAERPFTLGFIFRLVLGQRPVVNDVVAASVMLSLLAIVPPLLIMLVIDRVISHQSTSTLALITVIFGLLTLFEAVFGYARRELVQVLTARVDTRLNLHIFARLLALPLDVFERTPAGQTTFGVLQVMRVREFITGKLLSTFLDILTMAVLLPFLLWLNATLACIVLLGAALIAALIMLFLPPIGRVMARVQTAEAAKSGLLVETVVGMRTIKSLALEGQRKNEWDARVATAAECRLEAGRLANWPQTMMMPLERFIERGTIMVGAYLVLGQSGFVDMGSLVAFMMLGGRVAAPLVGLARLLEDFQDIRAAIGAVNAVLNNRVEQAGSGGLRPEFRGAVSFEDLSFTYPSGKTPALERVSFSIPAGTMLGVVGRSGSGKSTITRLLQGINRDYSGFLKIDGAELREINLQHLRRSFGVVLQDNFLFRGSVRDNITAGRANLTIEDVVRVSRLAGAEEFIERLPQGYETMIEEGSANLSGGQRQRLAIARALIDDPKLMILDEATSALDPESEALVNANLTRIARGRTMVIVSHRLSSLVDCDKILVMDRGTVVDIAPHGVLVERCAIYRALWLQQNRHLDPQGARAALLATVSAQGD